MEENRTIKTPETEAKPKRKLRPFQFLNGEFLQKEGVLKHMPFLFFLAVIAALYIANKYYGENKVLEINQLNTRLKESHSEYIAGKALLTEKCKQTQVEQQLVEKAIKVSVIPPRVIHIDAEQGKKIY